MNPKVDLVLYDGISIRSIGASGVVKIIAPFPSSESEELPYKFTAITLEYTLAPQCKLNGYDLRVLRLISQNLFATTS